MNSSLSLFVATALLLFSACDSDQCNFKTPPDIARLFSSYSKNDTIYFKSENGDLDTIVISGSESFCEMAGGVAPTETVSYTIRHLPVNKWDGGGYTENGKMLRYDEEIIATESSEEFIQSIGIGYRHAAAELILDQVISDSLFTSVGVKKYWRLTNVFQMKDSSDVSTMYWSEEYGLTAYELYNGESYRIVAP